MTKYIYLFVFIVLFTNCQQKKQKVTIVQEVPTNFDMYKTSEMADLMRTMLAKNKELKHKIEQNKSIGAFDSIYYGVHTAQLTDSTDLDATYSTFANHFLKMQQDIFEVASEKQEQQFNAMVDACIACHKDRCTGPIPRIEKLRIK